MNRLTSAQTAGTDCTKTTANGKTEYWGNSYGYDPWGNLGQKTVTKCSAENLGVSASVSNQLVGYNYDAAGNMISDPSDAVSVTYDPENRIASVTQGGVTTTYTYDGDGNRVKKATGSTGMLYWYGLPGALAESDLTGTIKSEYVFFNGTRVARRDEVTPAGVYYYFSDHIKSASLVTDAAGNVKSESDYYPWGGELAMSNSDSNHYKFTGKEKDSESGLDYFGARFYSAAMGRFMTPDWSEKPVTVPYADLSDPQTFNLYSYVRNSPVARFDADGHFVTSAGSATAPACSDGTSSCMPNQNCSDNVTSNCVNSTTTTVTIHGAGNNNDEAVVDGKRTTVWTDSNGNQHTTIATTEVLVGGEGNWKPGVISVTGSSTTYDSSGKAESSSHFGQVEGAYYTATASQVAAAVGVLGGTKALNDAMKMANPDWVRNTANNIASDMSHHPIRTIGRALGIAALTVDPPTTVLGASLALGAAAGDAGSAIWEDK
jgi:RHS repeat-associated protein